jgi:hypothetical protein
MWECHVRERRRNCELALGREARRLQGLPLSVARWGRRQFALCILARPGGLPQSLADKNPGSAAFLWPTGSPSREREMRIETKPARIGDTRIESDSFGKGESKKGVKRTFPRLGAPGSRDRTRRLKARTKSARIRSGRFGPERERSCNARAPRLARFAAIGLREPTPLAPAPSRNRTLQRKREQTARESQASRFDPAARGLASAMTVGSPISPVVVKRRASPTGGPGPARRARGRKREQRARESRGAIRAEPARQSSRRRSAPRSLARHSSRANGYRKRTERLMSTNAARNQQQMWNPNR